MKIKKIIGGLIILNLVIILIAVSIGIMATFIPQKGFAQDDTDDMVAGETTETPANVMFGGFMAAAIATGIGSLGAGIAVGSVGSAAMGAISEKPELVGRALIFVGLAEGIAIYGLIISIMILGRL